MFKEHHMIQLYYSPGTACLAPHFLMEELGLPYELVLVDTAKKEHQQAAYLQLNPNGKIPLLIDGDLQLTESAAICKRPTQPSSKDEMNAPHSFVSKLRRRHEPRSNTNIAMESTPAGLCGERDLRARLLST
jgi:hypothetical protein